MYTDPEFIQHDHIIFSVCIKDIGREVWLYGSLCVCLSKRYLSLTACNAMSGGFGRNESGRWNCRLRSDLSPSTRTHDGGSEDQDDIRRKVDQKNEKKKKKQE